MDAQQNDYVIEHFRRMKETVLHKRVIGPLLKAMGAKHLEYLHGPNERGKDFVYLARGFYGQDQLTVCQVKNKPFSGRAADSESVTAVLNQLVQCRKTLVLNPATGQKELPEHVVLITAYGLPDAPLSDGGVLLQEIRTNACEIIGPERLVDLVREHLQELYYDIALPGTGIQRALAHYLGKHHEAAAFSLSPERDRFFVNLGVAGASDLVHALSDPAIVSGLEPVRARQDDRELLEAAQDLLDGSQASNPVVRVAQHTDSNALYMYLEGRPLQELLRRVKSQIRNSTQSGSSGLRLLRNATLYLQQLASVFGVTAYRTTAEDLPELLSVPTLCPEAILDARINICLVGRAGAGKTSMCRAIAQAALKRGSQCVYFPCHTIAGPTTSLRVAAGRFLASLAPKLTSKMARDAVAQAKVIIVDGCDEAATFGTALGQQIRALAFPRSVAVAADRTTIGNMTIPNRLRNVVKIKGKKPAISVTRMLEEVELAQWKNANSDPKVHELIAALHRACLDSVPQVIVSTRDDRPLDLGRTFMSLSLLPLDDERLSQFFSTWFSESPSDAKAIMSFLKQNPHIGDVCRVPITAAIVASLRENRYDLPQSRTELYESYFDLMIERWDQVKHVRQRNQVRPKDKRMVLRKLAWHLHTDHKRLFGLELLDAIWSSRLAARYPGVSVRDVLDELQYANSLVFQEGGTEYSLGHLSFQEFLAAEAAVYGAHQKQLVEYFTDPWWSQVISFYAGKCGDIEDLIAGIHTKHGANATAYPLFSEVFSEARFTSERLRKLADDLRSDYRDRDEYDEWAEFEADHEDSVREELDDELDEDETEELDDEVLDEDV